MAYKEVNVTDPNSCPYGTSTATVKNGVSGTHVSRCQWYLSQLGYSVGTIDGICGAKTAAAIQQFQRDHGLSADGICGQATWAALEAVLAARNAPQPVPEPTPAPEPQPQPTPEPVPQTPIIDMEDEDMTQEKFNEMMANYEAEKAKMGVSGWAKENWDRAVAAGVFDGTMPQTPLTREQAAAVVSRLGLVK